MNENNPINIETKRPLSPEEIAEMKRLIAETEKQNAAGEFLNAQEIVPQKPERAFQVHPEDSHAKQVEQIIGAPKAPTETHHEEVPNMPMPTKIHSPEEQKIKLSELIASPSAKVAEPGGADDLQHQFERLYEDQEKAA